MDKTKLWLGIGVGILAVVALVLAFGWAAAPTTEDVDAAKLEVPEGYVAEVTADQELLDAVTSARTEEQTAKDAALEELKAQHDAKVAELEGELQSKEDELAAVEEPVAGESLEGEVIDDLMLGDPVEFSVDDGDLDKLFDGEIEFDDEDYEVQEVFRTSGDLWVGYSLVDDEEFASDIALLITEKEALEYRYEFVDVIDMTDISEDEPLNIVFLGAPVEIVDIDGDELTFRTGVEYSLAEGDVVDFLGSEVELVFVGENQRVSVSVDGVSKIIDEGDDELVNGVSISVSDILVNSRGGFATITLSDEDAMFNQDDGDDYLDMDEWKFYIESAGDDLEALVVTYNEKNDDFEDALFLNDELCFPNEFICVQLYDELYRDYVTIEGSFDDFDEDLWDDTPVDKKAVMLEATSKVFEVEGEEVDVLYVAEDGSVYYEDNNDWYEANVDDVEIVNEDFVWDIDVIGGALYFGVPSDYLRFDTDFTNEILGAEEDDAESTDVKYINTNIGVREYDVLVTSGVVVLDVEKYADNDEFKFQIPSDIVEVEVLVY